MVKYSSCNSDKGANSYCIVTRDSTGDCNGGDSPGGGVHVVEPMVTFDTDIP